MNTVGIIVGRFQVSSLTLGQWKLIVEVKKLHQRIIIIIGVNPIKTTKTNPLNYIIRKGMVNSSFWENFEILQLDDCFSDEMWIQKLDLLINSNLNRHETAILYGGRDSFIPCYEGKGKYNCQILDIGINCSGTEDRKKDGEKILNNEHFRKGIIYATQNQFTNATPCVDVAIIHNGKLLLGKKKHENKYRFIGGHVDPGESFTETAYREVKEETNLKLGSIQYISDHAIGDWRHEKGITGISTVFYMGITNKNQDLNPMDDIDSLKCFSLDEVKTPEFIKHNIMEEHKPLLTSLNIFLK